MIRIPMTLQGFNKLKKELNKLKKNIRPKIISAISEARKHGDLKENAEYHAAREQQSFYEGQIKKIESQLNNAQVIDITTIPYHGKVIFGATIHVLNIKINKIFHFRIVGDDESDFKNNLISINSPIARGLIGKKISDIVLINTPSGNVNYKILKIEYI